MQTESVLDGAAQTARVDVPAVPGPSAARRLLADGVRPLARAGGDAGLRAGRAPDAAARSRLEAARTTTSALACLDEDSDATTEEDEEAQPAPLP